MQNGKTAADWTCQIYSKSDKDAVCARILALLEDESYGVWDRCRVVVLWRLIARREVLYMDDYD